MNRFLLKAAFAAALSLALVPAALAQSSGGTSCLAVSKGGTGVCAVTNHGVLLGSGTSDLRALGVPAAGTLLQGAASADPAWTPTPTLGVAGTTVGTLSFANETSGTVKLEPVTGALGTSKLTLPATTSTVAVTGNKLSAFASTTSAELAGVVSDESGTGKLLFGTAPDINGGTIDNAVIGGTTPAAGTFTDLTASGSVFFTGANQTESRRLAVINTGTGQLLSGDESISASALSNSIVGVTGAGLLVFANSPALAGTPTAPTASAGTSTTQIATTAFVAAANVATATALETARTIDGQSFDGSANITVIAPGTHAATSKTTPANADEIPLVDSAASNVLKKLTISNLKTAISANIGNTINGLTEDGTPEGSADYVVTYDASAGAPKKVLLDNLPGGSGGGGSSALPPGWIYGLTLSNDATDAINDIDIAAGSARDDANTVDLVNASTVIKQLDAAWAEGSNAGCLDTGTVADGTYHIFVIRNSTNADVDELCSTSATAPTMPSGYDAKRRVGSIIRASSAILGFHQDGNTFTLDAPITELNAFTPAATTAVTRTLSGVPDGIRVKWLASVGLLVTSTTAQSLLYSDLAVSDTTPDNAIHSFVANGRGATPGTVLGGLISVYTNTNRQVRERISAFTASTFIYLATFGWEDPLQ